MYIKTIIEQPSVTVSDMFVHNFKVSSLEMGSYCDVSMNHVA